MFAKFHNYLIQICAQLGDQPASHAPAMPVVAALLVVAEQLNRIAWTQEEAHK